MYIYCLGKSCYKMNESAENLHQEMPVKSQISFMANCKYKFRTVMLVRASKTLLKIQCVGFSFTSVSVFTNVCWMVGLSAGLGKSG